MPTLDGERSPAPFAMADIGWIDFESKSQTDIKKSGAVRYATEADAVMLAWAIGDEPVTVTAVKNFPAALQSSDLPLEFWRHHTRVREGKAIWAAFNAGFDRAIWNYATTGFPELEPHHIIDVMAQATAAGLPPDLFQASKVGGGTVKAQKLGKDLLRLFCLPGATATPQSHPGEWQALQRYARDDIDAMRGIFRCTRQLTPAEWREYWAMEAINERGAMVDIPMATAAAALAKIDRVRANAELAHLTGGRVVTVGQVKAMVGWLRERLPDDGVDILTKRVEEVDEETGELIKPAKFQLNRARIGRLLAYISDVLDRAVITPQLLVRLQAAERLLQIRYFGGSTTPAKYQGMLRQQVDGRLYGQYVFNGAGQTGRASSRGVQVHNLARDYLRYEHEAIEALLNGADYDSFAALGDPTPVSRKLSLLIRPTFIAPEGRLLVWSDWSQIEARVLPWLAGDDPRAEARVQIFADVDADPRLPDLYTRTAAELSHVPIEEVTKAMRQRGKVAELALGFCGGVGALQNMAASYGLFLPDDEAKQTVARWRAANPWCQDFAQRVWEAMRLAMQRDNFGQPVKVGRIGFVYLPDYLEGTLLMWLPSGRVLTYRKIYWQNVDVLDDDDQPTGEKKLELMFARGYGRIKLWPGMLLENATQATAADFLRGTLRRLEQMDHEVVLHTHDEPLLEASEAAAPDVALQLRYEMQRGFEWSEGLPIMSEETISPYYTKREFKEVEYGTSSSSSR